MAKNKHYVVWKGLNPGIYDNWADCKTQVEGQAGAKYKAFETREEAERTGSTDETPTEPTEEPDGEEKPTDEPTETPDEENPTEEPDENPDEEQPTEPDDRPVVQ